VTVINSIIRANTASKGAEISVEADGRLNINYSNFAGHQTDISIEKGGTLNWGVGNIDTDPLFADPGYWTDENNPNAVWVDGDYHLKSEYGRWNPNTQTWVTDDVTSPCIDAGDPDMMVGDEPFPSGIRINMGAYGGTTEASKTISDVPEVVNVNDSDNGSQVTLRQGQILAVTLESNPSTGYSWDRIEKENSILEKFGDTLYFPSEDDDGIVGAGGWEILYFKSINIGQETLELVYRRSWETDVEPAKTFSIDVVVN
jgi:predicted secreted protein